MSEGEKGYRVVDKRGGDDEPAAPKSSDADKPSSAPRGPADESLPEIDFLTFVLSLSTSALVHLGEVPAPDDQAPKADLPLAKQTIDLLGILQDKTKGNLTGEEERILDNLLYDLRLKYVEHTRAAGKSS